MFTSELNHTAEGSYVIPGGVFLPPIRTRRDMGDWIVQAFDNVRALFERGLMSEAEVVNAAKYTQWYSLNGDSGGLFTIECCLTACDCGWVVDVTP